jgi:hypothetical protein
VQPAMPAAAHSSFGLGTAKPPQRGVPPLAQCRRLAERGQPGNAAAAPQPGAAVASVGSAQQQLRLKTRLVVELRSQNRQLAGDSPGRSPLRMPACCLELHVAVTLSKRLLPYACFGTADASMQYAQRRCRSSWQRAHVGWVG